MIQKYTNKQISDALDKLPSDLQQAMVSKDVTDIIKDIGARNNLNVEQKLVLDDETGLVMLGFTHPRDFILNIAKRLQIDKETARKIAEEVNQRIFQPVRDSLKQIHGIEDSKPETRNMERETRNVEPATQNVEHKAEDTSSKLQAPSSGLQVPNSKLQPLEIKPISPMGNIVESGSEETIEQKIISPPTAPVAKFVPKIEPPAKIIPIVTKPLDQTPPAPARPPIPTPPATPPPNLPMIENTTETKLPPPSQTEIKKELNIKPQPIIRSSDPYRESL